MEDRLFIVHFVLKIREEEGGVVKAVLDLGQVIAAQGHRVLIVTNDASDAPADWRKTSPNNPQVIELARGLSPKYISREAQAQLKELITGAQIGHLHTPWEIANTQISRMFRSLSIPYVISVHGMLDDWCMQQKTLKKKTFLTLFGRDVFRHAAVVHFTAEGERVQAVKWIPTPRASCVQALALDVSPYENLPGCEEARGTLPDLNPDARRILFLSRLHPKKGLELLLEAAAILVRQGMVLELLIAGPGDPSYVNKLAVRANALGLEKHARFLGMVKGTHKLSLYQFADVFVLPTHQENFGLVLVEALACGTPVVTTSGTDIWPELQQAGAKIVGHSPAEIASAIDDVLSDDEQRRQLGLQGRDFVLRWLAPANVVAGYECMYRAAAGRAPSMCLSR